MELLLSLGIGLVIISILRFLNGLLDYLEGKSGFINRSISVDAESISIVSNETYYENLSRFIFYSNRREICHFRNDLEIAINVRYFEKFSRSENPNVIRNALIQFIAKDNRRDLLRCSSFIVLSNLDIREQDNLCKNEIIKLESMNLKMNSRKLIFNKKVLELVAIDPKIFSQ